MILQVVQDIGEILFYKYIFLRIVDSNKIDYLEY